jgi:GT2 family glycosyltransferase
MDPVSADAPLLSVIIPTCHRNQDLILCVEALRPENQQTHVAYEVIVTDDGRRSSAEEIVRQQYPWARWCPGPQQGPASNRNSGARKASGQWVLFLDDDCIPVSSWISAYSAAIRSFPEYSLFEGQTIGGPNSRTRSDHESPLNLQGGLLWSCNFCINRQLFLDVGGFDENFPVAYMEDTDLQFRLKERGHTSKFVADACVQHPWRPRKGAYFCVAMAKSLCYFVVKHPETRPIFADAWGLKRMIKIVVFEFPRNLFRFRDLSSFRVLYLDLLMAFEITRNLPKND